MAKSYRFFVYFLACAACSILGIFFLGAFFRPELPETRRDYPEAEVAAMLASRAAAPPAEPIRIQMEVDYSEGEDAPWYPKEEAPLLRDLVARGALPPVEERVGPEPVVMKGVDGPGLYGGTWTRVASSPGDVSIITWRLSASTLFRWSPTGRPIVPHMAKGYEVSDDYRVWTIFLRKGMRWSDGHPFTADDILFWWHNELGYFSDYELPVWLQTKGQNGEVEKVDDHTVRFIFQHPRVTFLEALASQIPYAPAHYLSRFHPELGDPELIETAKRERGIDNPRSLYFALKTWDNVDIPRMWPWIYRNYRASPPQTFVRNPYYFAVDPQGRQLPYLDRVLFQEKTQALIPLSAAGGDVSMQTRHILFADYTFLMEKREETGYEVYHWFPTARSVWALFPNLNRLVEPDEPATRWKAEYVNKKRFRQALSLAIDRQRIIDAEYSGVGTPSQIEPGAGSGYHSPGLARSFTEFDPAKANRLLDVIGLQGRDEEGMRTFPDGTRMTWYLDFTDFTGEGPAQFVVEDWRAVGVRAIQRERSRPLFTTERTAHRHDFTIWSGESEFEPIVQPRNFVPTYNESYFAPGYGTWFAEGGLYGPVPETNERAIEPPPGSPVRRVMELYDAALTEPDPDKRRGLFKEIFAINAEEVWSISISTPPPQLVVVKDGFENVPEVAFFGGGYNTPANAGMETYYWKNPYDSEAAIEAMQASLLEPERSPGAVGPDGEEQAVFDPGKFLSKMLLMALALGIVLVAVRHPFIGRRFIVLVPTLFIISVAGFVMIQIPPGSFVETKILELQMSGDKAAIRQAEQLVERFHLDEPVWKQYMRWMGFKWFVTFDKGDSGLLQGNMGRSMENGESVNRIVGDRVLLTFLVSLGTVVFTWITALPIGVYSAIRQYSIGDYIFTFLGFIGMCVPNFLLAILLMYWSSNYLGINVTGLFSIEYATTPEWSWGKFVDLLKHIWVPIVIIGTAGTAGMIRVMRGNLLDELKKPYVTTARAKGVRPVKLLWKYPVRLALNPFISGIGGIFPMLVSGGAIVAIVLSLPMIGPVMLSGLMTQDVYLAASMLMMFSLLGVIGTLVSDLLLLWIDPRIRMEGGKR